MDGRRWTNLNLVGVSLLTVWIYLMFYQGTIIVPRAAESFDFSTLNFNVSSCALIATLLAFAVRPKALFALLDAKSWRAGVPLAMMAGVVLTVAGEAACSLAAIVAGALVTGVSSAVLACWWALALGLQRSGLISLHAISIIAVSIAVVTALSYFPEWVSTAFAVVLPSVSAWLLCRQCPRGTGAQHVREADFIEMRPSRRVAVLLALLYGSMFVLGFLPTFFLKVEESDVSAFNDVFCIFSLVVIVIALALSVAISHPRDFATAALAPCLLLVIALVPALTGTMPREESIASAVGYLSIEALLFILLVMTGKQTRFGVVRTYAIGRTVYILSDFVAQMTSARPLPFDALHVALLENTFTCVGVFILMLFAGAVLFGVPRGVRNAEENGSAYATSPSLMQRIASESTGSLFDGAAVAAADTPEYRADLLARTCHLTNRETDVAKLLISGYTSKSIQEKLCISKSTANYHVSNIYAKCHVHSKQSLIEFAEDLAKKSR